MDVDAVPEDHGGPGATDPVGVATSVRNPEEASAHERRRALTRSPSASGRLRASRLPGPGSLRVQRAPPVPRQRLRRFPAERAADLPRRRRRLIGVFRSALFDTCRTCPCFAGCLPACAGTLAFGRRPAGIDRRRRLGIDGREDLALAGLLRRSFAIADADCPERSRAAHRGSVSRRSHDSPLITTERKLNAAGEWPPTARSARGSRHLGFDSWAGACRVQASDATRPRLRP